MNIKKCFCCTCYLVIFLLFIYTKYSLALFFSNEDVINMQLGNNSQRNIEETLNDNEQFSEHKEYIDAFQIENSAFIDVLINEKYQLPYDHIIVGSSAAQYNNPTSIGLWLVYLVDVFKGDIVLDNMAPDDALKRLNTALESIVDMPKWNGLLGWSSISDSGIRKTGEASAYDNANFAASLGVVWGALTADNTAANPLIPFILGKVTKLLFVDQKKGWEELYDEGRGLIWGDENKKHLINILCTEGRLAPLMAIVLADIDDEVWNNLSPVYRNYQMSNGQEVDLIVPFQGEFQEYFPLIFVPEDEWSLDMAVAHQNYAAVQIDYANQTNLPALRSAASSPYYDGYVYNPELGVPGASQVDVEGNIGTPHANALLNLFLPSKAIALMQALDDFTQGEIHGPLGIRDSVGLNGEVSNAYLSLDHLIMTIAMAGKVNQEYFVNFLEATGKLDKIKSLYQNLDFGLDPIAIPEVNEFSIATSPDEAIEFSATGSLINFDQGNGRKGDYVIAFGAWGGPSGEISERVSSRGMEVDYNTPEYNGLWFKLDGLDSIGEYKEFIFDIKSEKGFDEIKIELKKSDNILGSFVVENIPKNIWVTIRIPIADFEIIRSDLEKTLDELVFVIEGCNLPSKQRSGVFNLDNIELQK